MSGIRISLKVKLHTVVGLNPIDLNRTIDWQGGRSEFDSMRAELQAAMDAASKARGLPPIDYVGTRRLSEILYAVSASGSLDATRQHAVARWLVAWILSQPVPDQGGIYADHLDKDWLFSLVDDGGSVNFAAVPLPHHGSAGSVTSDGKLARRQNSRSTSESVAECDWTCNYVHYFIGRRRRGRSH